MAKADIMAKLYAKDKNPMDFNFDAMWLPTLLNWLSPEDIARLNNIASSIKYSGKIEKKYAAIDEIMRSRGFVKFHAGTNRIVYRPIEDTRFVVKVAVDRVGLRDTPDEFRNQEFLKPFVTKVFETSPCGTVGTFERVMPITSREEFYSIAESIFELLNKKILGKYVLEDIGTNYFMNYGLRNTDGFGPVLLDFPYVFELDGNKLYCNRPIIELGGQPCGGTIDYDDGFNNLVCERCGKRYQANELRKKDSGIIVMTDDEADVPMKVNIVRGDKVERKVEPATDSIVYDEDI